MSHPSRQNLLPIILIMAALMVWGAFHALGAYLYNYDFRKPLIIYFCVGGFVCFWGIALVVRSRRLMAESEKPHKTRQLGSPEETERS